MFGFIWISFPSSLLKTHSEQIWEKPGEQTSRYLSHELFSGEHQLVVDDPARQLFKKGAVGVHEDRLLVLHRLVAALAEPRRVVEIPGGDSLEDEREADKERTRRSVIERHFLTTCDCCHTCVSPVDTVVLGGVNHAEQHGCR